MWHQEAGNVLKFTEANFKGGKMRERKKKKSQTFSLSPDPPGFYPSLNHLLCHQSGGPGPEPTNSPPPSKSNMLQNVCTVF